MRCNQGDHAIATEPKPVHPVGQPISASTNSGFKVRGESQEDSPEVGVTRTGRPSRPFTGVFAMGRVAGWISHAREQALTGRLIRPKSVYVEEGRARAA